MQVNNWAHKLPSKCSINPASDIRSQIHFSDFLASTFHQINRWKPLNHFFVDSGNSWLYNSYCCSWHVALSKTKAVTGQATNTKEKQQKKKTRLTVQTNAHNLSRKHRCKSVSWISDAKTKYNLWKTEKLSNVRRHSAIIQNSGFQLWLRKMRFVWKEPKLKNRKMLNFKMRQRCKLNILGVHENNNCLNEKKNGQNLPRGDAGDSAEKISNKKDKPAQKQLKPSMRKFKRCFAVSAEKRKCGNKSLLSQRMLWRHDFVIQTSHKRRVRTMKLHLAADHQKTKPSNYKNRKWMTKITTKSKTKKKKQFLRYRSKNAIRTCTKRTRQPSPIPSSQKSAWRVRQLVTQAQTIAPRELMQSGGRGRTSPPLCKFFESLRIAFFLF